MQDIHSIGAAGSGRIFTTGAGGVDRRLRPQHNTDHNNGHSHQQPQVLKCPRCDSLNTKFCYYNNYNLSQPRHFCKSCRRYWTKGGVLRNVPVGGGCRKKKRSSSKPKAAAEREIKTTTKESSNSHSSSESSSTLTAAAAAAGTTTTTTETVLDTTDNSNNDNKNNENFEMSVNDNGGGACFEQPPLIDSGNGDHCGGIFSEIGSFTNLINSSSNETMTFGFSNILSHHQQGIDERWPRQHHHQSQQQKSINGGDDEDFKGLLDQTVNIEFSALQNRSTVNNEGGFGPLDWQGGGFDLTNTVDQAYWSQNLWTTTTATTADQDHSSLYLP